MLSNLDPASQRFLADFSRIQANNATAQQQLSSGLKVQAPSDSPDQIGILLQLESERSSNSQIKGNLGRVQTEVNSADDAISTAVQLIDKITQLTGQGLSADTAQSRTVYAGQIQNLEQQLVAITSTTVEGRYIFDGKDGTAAPYSYNTATNSVVRVRGTAATRQIQDSSGASYAYARSAQDIFDERDALDNPTANNIFSAIDQAIAALNTNNTAGINTAIGSLHTVATFLGTQQIFYGEVQNHLATSLNQVEARDVALKTQIGAIRDADSVEASLALSRGDVQQQAALAAEAKSQTKSLFDYLA